MENLELPDSDLSMLSFGDFSLDKLNSTFYHDNSNVSGEFSFSDFYLNYSDSELFSAENLTALEDFEEFDGRDLMNVIAYATMSLGKDYSSCSSFNEKCQTE